MKLTVDTSKLHLPGPGTGAAWAAPPDAAGRERRLDAIRALARLGLPNLVVRRLVRRLTLAREADAISRNWPTIGEDRAALAATANLAGALAACVRGASDRAQVELWFAGREATGDEQWLDSTARSLAIFAAALQSRVTRMPTQQRRQSRSEVVRIVAEIAGDHLGAVTRWESSPFRQACIASFQYIGVAGSPDRAIDAFSRRTAER